MRLRIQGRQKGHQKFTRMHETETNGVDALPGVQAWVDLEHDKDQPSATGDAKVQAEATGLRGTQGLGVEHEAPEAKGAQKVHEDA